MYRINFEPLFDAYHKAADAKIEGLRYSTWDSDSVYKESENICENEGFRHIFDGKKKPGFRGCGIPQKNSKNEQFCGIHQSCLALACGKNSMSGELNLDVFNLSNFTLE